MPSHHRWRCRLLTVGALIGVIATVGCERRAISPPGISAPPVLASDLPPATREPTIADSSADTTACQLLWRYCRDSHNLMTHPDGPPAVVTRLNTWNAPGQPFVLYLEAAKQAPVGVYDQCHWLLFFNAQGQFLVGQEFAWPIVAHGQHGTQWVVVERDYDGRLRSSKIATECHTTTDVGSEDHASIGEVFTPIGLARRDYRRFEALFGSIDPGELRAAMDWYQPLATFVAPGGDRFDLVRMARGWNGGSSRHWTERLAIFDMNNRPVALWILDRDIAFEQATAIATGFCLPAAEAGHAVARLDWQADGAWQEVEPSGLLVAMHP